MPESHADSDLSLVEASSPGWFPSTHWSAVLAAREASDPVGNAALEQLCASYWYPLYVYVRRLGHSPEDAQDLTQDFFARMLGKGYFSQADRTRGKFRTFLLTALKNHLVNDFHNRCRIKRGGSTEFVWLDSLEAERRFAVEPVDTTTPETLFERRWALTLLEESLELLREEYEASGRGLIFEALKDYIWGNKNTATYATVASQLGVSEEATKKAVQRLRQRLRDHLRFEISKTVATITDVDGEFRHLIEVLRK